MSITMNEDGNRMEIVISKHAIFHALDLSNFYSHRPEKGDVICAPRAFQKADLTNTGGIG